MADLARMAGVSISTVSRALSDSPLINVETRARIAELARSLNYSINVGAQNLRLKQNRTVSVIVPYDPQTQQHLTDTFFLSLIGDIADALSARGYDTLLSRVDANHLNLAEQYFATGRSIGVILVGQWLQHDQLNEMALRRVPFVVWGGQMPGQLYATVGTDNIQGGKLAADHLMEQGARRIVFLGDTELPEVGQRFEGYLRAHQARGAVADPQLCRRVPFVVAEAERAVEQLVKEHAKFDAIFASSDLLAMTAINVLRSLGVNVPDDVLVAGYDDIELAAHFHPALTTVRQPLDIGGQKLVEALLSQVAGEPPRSHLLATTLVQRLSTARGAAAVANSRPTWGR